MRTQRQKRGIKAVTLHEAARAAPVEPAEQLALLPLGELGDRAIEAPEGPGRRGRPAGARNKRTEEWQDYLLTRYRSPLEALAQIYSRPTAELARALGCKPIEALEKQIAAARDLAPYLHSRLPQAIDLKGVPAVPLTINLGVAAAAGALANESEENQDVIRIAGRVVGRGGLDADREALAEQGVRETQPLMEDQRTEASAGDRGGRAEGA